MAQRLPIRRVAPELGRRIALLALLAVPPLAAQRLPFTVFTTDDGLAATQIWDLHLDRRGYLWVATTWGLCRYDGESFSTFSVGEGLPSPNVRTILEDQAGRLWIGTNHGVAMYDGRRIETLAELGGLAPGPIWASAVDARGHLWFGTERGLVLHDGKRMRRFGREDGLADDYVYALLAAADGALWIGSRGAGVARCELAQDGSLGSCRRFGIAEGLGAGQVRALAQDRRGTIYIGTRGGGISTWDGAALRDRGTLGGGSGADVYALEVNRRDELVVGSSDRGLSLCSLPALGRCLAWNESNGLPHTAVRALVEDPVGMLWVGTEAGLARLMREDLWSYGAAEGLPDAHVYALAPAAADEIWIGTVRGLAKLATGPHGAPRVTSWRGEVGPAGGWVWALEALPDGRLWVGGERGLCRLAPGGLACEETYGAADGLARDQISALYVDRTEALWIGTPSALARLASATAPGHASLEVFRAADGLAADAVYDFAEDREGRLWIAHGTGLSWRDGAGFHAVGPAAGLPLAAVRSLGVAFGDVWAGGYGTISRLAEFTAAGPRFERYEVRLDEEGLLVLTFAEDEHGRLLLGTNRGVCVFDRRAREGRGEIRAHFDRAAGTIGTEVSHSGAYVRDRQGRHWFGFKGGVTVFPVDLEAARPAPPAVAFEQLRTTRGRIYHAPFSAVDTGGRSRWFGAGPVRLAPRDNGLRVVARALTFRREVGVRFQFQLVGLEEDWGAPKHEPFRDYTNLDPGDYVLRSRASEGGSPWGPAAELAFTLQPALWQTGLFRASAALALVALGVVAVLGRARRSSGRARELEREVAGRTDDLARYARALSEHLAALDRGSARVRDADRHRRELFARLSHEVRTPLTSILGFSELLESSASPRLTARELRFLANVRESGNHLLRLVNDLLDQAKLEAGRMDVQIEPVELGPVLTSLVSLVEGFALSRDVRIEIQAETDLPEVEVDVAKLRQIVLNLLSNAIKFSPPGGTVVLAARRRGSGETPLGEAAYEIEVRDNGPGIRAEDLATIFEPYRQAGDAHERRPGTGLGLPIARQLLRLLGGRIEVESAPGEGARFQVLLPVHARLPEAVGEAVVADEAASQPRVLVVEADREGFADLAAHVENDGFLAVRAPDLEEARRMMPEIRPAAVVLRIDPARPEGWSDAATLDRELVREGAPLVLLALAGARRRGWALGFDRVLPADAEPDEIASALTAVVRAGAPPGRRGPVLLIGGPAAARASRAFAIRSAGFEPLAPEDAAGLRAAFSRADLAAALLDPESHVFVGLTGIRAAQAAAPDLPWILLASSDLAAPARRLYAEEVEAAIERSGDALGDAVTAAFSRSRRVRDEA